jgi:antitoxin ParD1/3/4
MANTTMNLSIPRKLKERAQQLAKKKNFSSASDYLQHLIREDDDRDNAQKQLNAFLQKGIDSGKAMPMNTTELRDWMANIVKNEG